MADTTLTFDIIARDRGASRTARKVARAIDGIDDSSKDVSNGLKGITNSFDNLADRGKRSMAIVGAVIAGLPAMAVAAGGLVALALGGALSTIGIVAAAQNKIVQKQFTDLRDHVVKTMKEISAPFVSTLLGIAGIARRTFDKFVPFLTKAFKILAPAVREFVDNLAVGLEKIAPLLPGMATAFEKVAASLGPELPGIIESVMQSVMRLVQVVAENPEAFTSLVLSLTNLAIIGLELAAALAVVAPMVTLVTSVIGPLLIKSVSLIPILNRLGDVVRSLGPIFRSVVNVITTTWNMAVSATQRAMARMRNAVSTGVTRVLGLMRSLPGRIRSAVGSLGGILYSAGRAVIQGLINGIRSALGALRSVLSSVTSLIPSWKGPLTTDLRLLTPSGKAIMSGLVGGIRAGEASLRAALAGVTDRIASTMASPMVAGVEPVGPPVSGQALGRATTVTVRILVDGADEDMKRMIRKMVRVDGHGDVQVAFG